MAAGKPDARRFRDIPGYFPVLRKSSRLYYSSELQQPTDILDDFEMDSAESNNFPVISRFTGIFQRTQVN
jgi:hypothetical protein